MIEDILPDEVISAATTEDPADATLFPEEQALLARAVDKRRREFTTARHCARLAMAKLGVPAAPILPGERGAPQWPERVVGSMTHTAGYRAAALAHDRDIISVGIDAEPHGPLPEGVLDAVSSPAERAWITAGRASHPELHLDRLLFCAKESVYKTWFPITRRWLGFEDAEIEVDLAERTFSARILVEPGKAGEHEFDGFRGRWLVRDGLILAAIAVPAR